MAPVRRYLRITKWSVLEVRIYLDSPSLAHTWLLNPRDPALPRVMQAVRPLVLPKLREENERAKGGKGKGKARKTRGIKDSVSEDDFEVSIFLTDLSTPHSLLTKRKDFHDKAPRLKSNSGKLTGWLAAGGNDDPVEVGDDGDDEDGEEEGGGAAPMVIREESDDEQGTRLEDYPEAEAETSMRGPGFKRKRSRAVFAEEDVSDDGGFQADAATSEGILDEEGDVDGEQEDDKKKLGMNTTYDGFSIYGRILCLIVKRKGDKGKGKAGEGAEGDTARQMLENWVSTQAAQEPGVVDDDG